MGRPPGRLACRTDSGASGAQLVFTAAPGKNNVVTVSPSGGDLLVHDGEDTISPGTGCTAVDANTARCSGASFVVLDVGDGDDTASNNASLRSDLHGGPGKDVLNGGTEADLINGDEGDDTLNGNDGDDTLQEGRTPASTDVLDVDTFTGGPARDTISYGGATTFIRISLDGAPNDGPLARATTSRRMSRAPSAAAALTY